MRSVWGVVALALILGFIAIITGKWSTHYMFLLVILILLGSLLPTLALGFGGLVLLWEVLRNPQLFAELFSGDFSRLKGVFK